MNYRTTAILFVLLLVLGGGYVAMNRAKEAKVRHVALAKQLFDFGPTALKRVTVDRIDGEPVVGVQAAPGSWRIEAPNPEILASDEVWNRVAENFAGLVNERALLEEVDDPALYGLAEPILEVQGEVESGRMVKLRFGDLDPTQSLRYALLDDKTLFLVNGSQFYELNRELDLLRHSFLLDDRSANLLRIEMANIWRGDETEEPVTGRAIGDESPPLILQRESVDAPWRMVAPIQAAADQEKAEQIAAEIRGVRGRSFVDAPEHLSDYGLAPARFRITVVDDKAGAQQTILLGDLDQAGSGGLFAKRADRKAVFLMDPHIATLIPTAPLDLRDRRMLTRRIEDITRVEYEWSGARFTLDKDPEHGWGVSAPPVEDEDQGAISRFLASLKAVQAAEFVDASPTEVGLDRPDVQIRLTYSGDLAPMAVRIAKRQEESDQAVYYAVQQDSGDVMRVEPSQVQALHLDVTSFRKRRLFDFDRHLSTVLDISANIAELAPHYRFEKVHGQWMVRAPENGVLRNQTDVEQVLERLVRLEAVGIERVDTGDDLRYGLEEPLLMIEVTTADGAEASVTHGPLRVGGLVGESLTERYARMAGREGVFRVHQDLVSSVRAPLGFVAPPPGN